ncbi:MAG: hypothetical protein JWN93_2533, partial [Hyphomicrobiales bacterium]|nr:hypothetical protein [Hyphomicrobiales bacterium]
EDAPTAPVRTARTTPDASAAAPAQRKGGAGATWAVYFDHFPDMKSAAAKINGLQGKYGPYLAGRKLTYGRSGAGGYRVRVTGLTEDAAQAMCGKVKGAGSLCAVGGK